LHCPFFALPLHQMGVSPGSRMQYTESWTTTAVPSLTSLRHDASNEHEGFGVGDAHGVASGYAQGAKGFQRSLVGGLPDL
jgi:hypothetical protein